MNRASWLVRAWAVLVLVLAVRLIWVVSPAGSGKPIRVEPLVLDPNLASVEELQLLPGVGRSRAEQIVLERIRRGPFRSLAELERVDGIGQATVDDLARYLEVATPVGGSAARH